MNRRITGLAALAMLFAACSSSHPHEHGVAAGGTHVPAPKPSVNVVALQAYEETIDGFASPVSALSRQLRGCATPAPHCHQGAASSESVAATLLHRLLLDDGLRETTNSQLLPGISPLVVKTEIAARSVKRTARSASTHFAAPASQHLATQMRVLSADIAAWEPGGSAAQAIAAAHVPSPTASASP